MNHHIYAQEHQTRTFRVNRKHSKQRQSNIKTQQFEELKSTAEEVGEAAAVFIQLTKCISVLVNIMCTDYIFLQAAFCCQL